jgi:enoyl-CoA hydratase
MEHLVCETHGDIAILRVNRPQVLNALNHAVLEELKEFFEVSVRHQKLKAVILTGTGDKAFIAGADIKEIQAMNDLQVYQFCQLGQRVANSIESSPCLTIAAVHGYALGGGFEMALACDLIYVSYAAEFGFPEVTLGLIPGFGGTYRLLQAIGPYRSKEMIMSGKTISANAAHSMGIVSHVCDFNDLLGTCESAAKAILAHPCLAVIKAKHVLNSGKRLNMDEALKLERDMFAACFENEDSKKAIAAFLDRRKKG